MFGSGTRCGVLEPLQREMGVEIALVARVFGDGVVRGLFSFVVVFEVAFKKEGQFRLEIALFAVVHFNLAILAVEIEKKRLIE